MKKQKVVISLAMLALTLGGCAKKREYDTLVKEDVLDKSVISTTVGKSLGDEYIYVPSMLDAPHSTNGTFPGWLGQERIVRFRFTKDALLAETVVDDPRFSGNPTNSKPVLTIPVSHVDYRCAENAAGNCSNREEEVDDKNWESKTKFKPNVQALRVTEVNTLPIEIDRLFENCHQELGERLIGYSLEPEAVRIEVEKTYRSNIECLSELDSLSDLTFNVRHVHSFVKRNSLVSKNYAPVLYPNTDEGTFGFFTTEQHKLSEDNRPEEKGDKVLMNRWNPARKTIPYLLSSNLDKPELAKVKVATLEAISAVNRAFADAGVDLKIDARVAKEGELLGGDIRQSAIIVNEDPQATGVIGYGPSTADPRTGEIISGRVMMYLGTMKKFVRGTWEDHLESLTKSIDESEEATSLNALSFLSSLVGGTSSSSAITKDSIESILKEHQKNASKEISEATVIDVSSDLKQEIAAIEKIAKPSIGKKFDRSMKSRVMSDITQLKVKNFIGPRTLDEEMYDKVNSRVEAISKYNVYLADLVNFEGALAQANLDELKDIRKVAWEELTEEEQNKVIDAVLPFVWVPTLVHEIGHNIGLRHNFAGSEDKDNFYSKEESEEHGHSHAMPYSSVMDYGYNSLKEIRVMGKYDVAALKFAYNREVETKTGEILKVQTTLKDLGKTKVAELKEFQFCTDEHVGPNVGCRRFDEGTNFTEIAQHLARAYEKTAKRLNHRMGRRNFSISGDLGYLMRQEAAFFEMRPFFELTNRIAVEFEIPLNSMEWVMEPFLRDLLQATLTSRQALTKPLLEPSRHCVAELPDGSHMPIPMEATGKSFPSCFHPDVKDLFEKNGLKLAGQFGKSINNEKYSTSENPYVDQIDVRGIWMDKVLGGIFLTQRRLGLSSFDNYRGNFVDTVPGVANELVKIIDGYLLNKLDFKSIVATKENGKTFKLKDSAGKDKVTTIRPFNTHMIPPSHSRAINRFLGLSQDDTPFAQVLLQNVLIRMKDTFPNQLNQAMREYYGIKTFLNVGDDASKFISVDVEGQRYLIDESKHIFAAKVAKELRLTEAISAAVEELIEQIKKQNPDKEQEELEALIGEKLTQLVQIAKDREAGKALPEGLTEVEKKIAELPSATIDAAVKGQLQSPDYLKIVIRMLGDANRWVEQRQ